MLLNQCRFKARAASSRQQVTDWNHFELRQYDPVIGRTLILDPYGQSFSGYSWLGGNPVSGVDPTGGICETCPKRKIYDRFRESNLNYGYSDLLDGDGAFPRLSEITINDTNPIQTAAWQSQSKVAPFGYAIVLAPAALYYGPAMLANITRQGLLNYGRAVAKDAFFETGNQLVNSGFSPEFYREIDVFDILTTGRNSRYIALAAGAVDIKASGDVQFIFGENITGHAENHKGLLKFAWEAGLNAGTGRVSDKPGVPFGRHATLEILSGILSERSGFE